MSLPPQARAHFAEKHIDDAIRLQNEVGKKRAEDAEANQRTYERCYTNLALFSSGTVALSITYLGYLKTLPKPIVHPRLLEASWVCLFVCLSCSLFWSFFVSHYGHYARNREYSEATKKRYETEISEIEHVNLANLRTQEELTAYRNPRLEAIQTSGSNAKWNEKREKFYQRVWVWDGRLARAVFVVGLGLLLVFAMLNR